MKISTLEFIHKLLREEKRRTCAEYERVCNERGGDLDQIADREDEKDRLLSAVTEASAALMDFEMQDCITRSRERI